MSIKGLKLKLILVPFIILALIFTALIFLQINSVAVYVSKVDCVSADQLKKELNYKGKNYFTLDKRQITEDIQNKHVCISSLSLSYRLPNNLDIEVNGREPKVLLKEKTLKLDVNSESTTDASSSALKSLDLETQESSDSSIYVSDGFGIIYSKTENTSDLPLIEVINQDLEIKDDKHDLIVNTLAILERLKNMYIVVSNLKVLGDQLHLESKPKLKFTLSHDLDRQTASLQLILQKDKMRQSLFPMEMKLRFSPTGMSQSFEPNETNIEMIDLRFDKPIVVYTPKKG